MNFLRIHQLNIMLSMASISGIITLFIFISQTIPRQRKKSLIFMETASMFLLLFDRYAYIYRGNTTSLGYWMVRISNFIVFLMSLILIYGYNGYLKGRLMEQESITKLPGRLIINAFRQYTHYINYREIPFFFCFIPGSANKRVFK